MSGLHTFTGGLELFYPEYMDEDTGKPLRAAPGDAYSMRPLREGLPVPPPDGRWEPVRVSESARKSLAKAPSAPPTPGKEGE